MAQSDAPTASGEGELVDDIELVEHSLSTIFRLSRNFRFQEAVHQRAGFAVDRASYGLLARVGDLQPVRLSDLAHVLGVDVSTTSRQVASLEHRGLLIRDADPDDGRAVRLALTTDGVSYLQQLSAAWHEIVADALIDWLPSEIDRFAQLFERFVDNLDSTTDRTDA